MNDKSNHVSVLALNPAVDISYVIPQLLEYQKVRAEQTFYHAGGNGINITRALIELGIPAHCCSIIAGESGDLLLKLLDIKEDKHKWFRVEGETRINTTITQQNPPGQFEISSIGPQVPMNVLQEVCDSLLDMAGNGIAVLSGQIPPGVPESTYGDLVTRVNKQGGRVVVDTHGDVLQRAIEAGPWMVRFNRHILETSISRRLDAIEDVAEAVRTIQQRGIDYVCVTLGEIGAVLVDGDNSYHLEAPRIHKQSTVGCGDSMVTGLIASAIRGETTRQMLQFGIKCASATASHPGTELFTREDLESDFLDTEATTLDL